MRIFGYLGIGFLIVWLLAAAQMHGDGDRNARWNAIAVSAGFRRGFTEPRRLTAPILIRLAFNRWRIRIASVNALFKSRSFGNS
jgi:hypothetical protein